jgi:hypothetical protein
MIRDMLFAAAASSTWTPASLFTGGEKGLWLDASDYTTLFQDYTGSTPVTANSQPVGLWQDKSGNGNHISQNTSSKRGLTNTTSGKFYIQFDAVDDQLQTVTAILTGTNGISGCIGAYASSFSGTSNDFFEWNNNLKYTLASATSVSSLIIDKTVTSSVSVSLPRSIVMLSYGEKSAVSATVVLDGTTTTGSQPSTEVGTGSIKIPARGDRGVVYVGQVIVVNRQLTSTEKQQLVDYVASKA